jgi:hypothetical protein
MGFSDAYFRMSMTPVEGREDEDTPRSPFQQPEAPQESQQDYQSRNLIFVFGKFEKRQNTEKGEEKTKEK